MQANEIREGLLYRLTREVVNPSPDRGKPHDLSALPVWKPGIVFAPTFAHGAARLEGVLWSLRVIEGGERYGNHIEDSSRIEALAPALEPFEPRTPDDVLAVEDWRNLAREILDKLHAWGRFSLQDVRGALAAVLADYDAQEAQREAEREA